MIASLFYFELAFLPQRRDGKYLLTGHIMCSIRRGDPALEALLIKLESSCGRFLVNGCPTSSSTTNFSFLGQDGNVQIRVITEIIDKFTISLDTDEDETCHISGSPFSVPRLIKAQGLDAPFGRSDHHKRKRSDDSEALTRKKRQTSPCIK
jgi:hypothetical protein